MSNLPPAKKSLGQCFLVEKRYAQEIVAALGITKEDTIVEIGPGRGFLTEELLKTPASKIIAVEIDRRLQEMLTSKFADSPNFELHHADFVETDLSELLPRGPVKVVGNLPYHLSAEIIYRLLEHARIARQDDSLTWIETAVVMTQKEVADRIVAGPGTKTYGKLSVFVQLEANASPVVTVPAEAFRPQPKVDGGVIRLDFQKIPEVYPIDLQTLVRIVRFCFHQRRKMLKKSLSSMAGIHPFWEAASIDFTRRPETLSLTEWVHLSDTVSDRKQPV